MGNGEHGHVRQSGKGSHPTQSFRGVGPQGALASGPWHPTHGSSSMRACGWGGVFRWGRNHPQTMPKKRRQMPPTHKRMWGSKSGCMCALPVHSPHFGRKAAKGPPPPPNLFAQGKEGSKAATGVPCRQDRSVSGWEVTDGGLGGGGRSHSGHREGSCIWALCIVIGHRARASTVQRPCRGPPRRRAGSTIPCGGRHPLGPRSPPPGRGIYRSGKIIGPMLGVPMIKTQTSESVQASREH